MSIQYHILTIVILGFFLYNIYDRYKIEEKETKRFLITGLIPLVLLKFPTFLFQEDCLLLKDNISLLDILYTVGWYIVGGYFFGAFITIFADSKEEKDDIRKE